MEQQKQSLHNFWRYVAVWTLTMEIFLMFSGFPMNWGLGAGFGGMNQGFGNSGGRGESIVSSLKDRHIWDRH